MRRELAGLLPDINIKGRFRILLGRMESATWREIWSSLRLTVHTFEDLGLARSASDSLIWKTCQQRGLVLVTANRNQDGAESLEAVIRQWNSFDSLPVLTLANPERLVKSKRFAEAVTERLLDILINVEHHRGAGRLYIP